ncbi:amidase signature domain-containing protein [Abortiporus biennis]|nr:amidase signature domain-containing protein [Abortiporus biennis]
MFFTSSAHHTTACATKQQDIANKVAKLASVLNEPLTDEETRILALPIPDLVEESRRKPSSSAEILQAFGKQALSAHAATNCLSDLMFDEALAHAQQNLNKPLSGVPISLKDCVNIEGHDTTIGYSISANRPASFSAPIVCLLRDAGALLHVKTTVPAGLLSFETTSDLYGTTTNPYNPAYSPGASTGGGGALLAYGGSKVEVATDIGGSVRYPAAFCGVYGLKGSFGRFPGTGIENSTPGFDALKVVASAMAGSLEDLREFWERVVGMEPWRYDYDCVPIPWKKVDLSSEKCRPRFGVLWTDGIVTPSPACTRALQISVEALRKQGYEVVDFNPPSTLEIIKVGFSLMFADGGKTLSAPARPGETISSAIKTVVSVVGLPLLVKNVMASILRLTSTRNEAWAQIIDILHIRTTSEERQLCVQRDKLRHAWLKAMKEEQNLDFILTVPHSLPNVPHGGSGVASLVAASYGFLFNVLDVSTGVIPVAFVDKTLDALPPNFQSTSTYAKMNDVERNVYSLYDPNKMHGLPLGIQIAAGRFEEEKALEGMRIVEEALKDTGREFVQKVF